MSTAAAATAVVPDTRWSAARTILIAGCVAGFLDIMYAITVWAFKGVSPLRILQSVAGGLMGRDAWTGGLPTAILGAVAHFGISIGAAAVFYWVATRWRLLTDRPLLSGICYGFGFYLFMQYVVLPLSAAPGGGGGNWRLDWMLVGSLFAHTILFGTPIALLTRYGRRGA